VRRVTLLTDFGTSDGYVAAMKGVIAALAPGVFIDDASHDIPPGDLTSAAWTLDGYWRLYPARSVHVVVVDPGVGSGRRPLACEAGNHFFVGPDNGVFTPVLRDVPDARVIAIENAALMRLEVSATFHGRDIFAPAAAHLLRGAPLDSFGPAVGDAVRLPEPLPSQEAGLVRGAVVHVDRFGNLITNIPARWVGRDARARVRGAVARRVEIYSDGDAEQLLLLTGSRGLLEIAVRNGSAAERLGAGRTDEVEVWAESASWSDPAPE
jgi:S-adenosyl-L-methionine hydrolase (adenosine-forming)